jgi:hypothetical protein
LHLTFHLQDVGLRFEAEAMGWLQNQSIALTGDSLDTDTWTLTPDTNADVSTPTAAHSFTQGVHLHM